MKKATFRVTALLLELPLRSCIPSQADSKARGSHIQQTRDERGHRRYGETLSHSQTPKELHIAVFSIHYFSKENVGVASYFLCRVSVLLPQPTTDASSSALRNIINSTVEKTRATGIQRARATARACNQQLFSTPSSSSLAHVAKHSCISSRFPSVSIVFLG